jgi:hypothetical protein
LSDPLYAETETAAGSRATVVNGCSGSVYRKYASVA